MEKLTDSAQGYCEMYCKKYGHCFGDPGDCVFQHEVKMYEALKDYECTGMSPMDIKTIASTALREQEERRWIPVTERLPVSEGTYLVYTERGSVYASHFYAKKVFRDDYVIEPKWSQRGKVKVTHWMSLPEPPKEDA